ncbi:helix-turn-helix domain-containing protein [Streptomyces roseirectus]|uniref:Helix-turn-helix domain-containing protein n=1 Tax=Streptomyces roseirectus TaxID=2768066 RepID=A0A7H0IK28_9ACTN|nr:helix-turn-helix transcriptional regulator [Streptomyces roseirectus]QNP73144.1 helix-turn-helix domain-containing protein [Streptomyces roseirectus]
MTFTPQELNPFLSARHYFGAELRRDREGAGMSLVQLAGIVASSKSTLARVETAELMPPPDLPPHLDAAFGTGDKYSNLYELARREAHPDQYKRFMDFEARAEVIETYGPQVVPGLLQTREYAHAQLSVQDRLTPEQLEQRVDARLSRQDRLRGANPPYYWAIIDESVLRRQVGTDECMRNQLAHLLKQVDTPDSKVQVSPFSSGPHSLMGGNLTLLTLPKGSAMAYEEGIEIGRLHEDPDSVNNWRRQYEVLRANSLSLATSAAVIRQAMEDY